MGKGISCEGLGQKSIWGVQEAERPEWPGQNRSGGVIGDTAEENRRGLNEAAIRWSR